MNGDATADDRSGVLWSDARRLGYAPMDHTHEAFYAAAWRLMTAEEAGAVAAMEAFAAHALDHFGLEERWMAETGFPARQCHADEHAAVLASVREVHQAVVSGQAGPDLLHRLAEHLFAWFPAHADYMDSALAAWMSRQTLGGTPVVFKRSVVPARR